MRDQRVADFIHKHCIACGGNWIAMLHSGIVNATKNREDSDVYLARANEIVESQEGMITKLFELIEDIIALDA